MVPPSHPASQDAAPADDGLPVGWDPRDLPELPVAEVPEDERIGNRDLAQWHTRPGRWVRDTIVNLVEHAPARVQHWGRWSVANAALVVTVLLGGLLVLALNAAAGEVYEAVVQRDGVAAFDQPALDAAVAHRSPTLDARVTDFTDIGGKVGMPILALVVTLALALSWRKWTPVILMGVAALGSIGLTIVGKDLIGRARPPRSLAVPPYESSASFPSGHTLNATVIIGMATYLLLLRWSSRWARVITVTLAATFVIAMGLSRVFLGHHWLTDVVAGWLLGLGWVVAVITAHRVQITLKRAPAKTA
jgi:undecaprenyl-diphosphatase